MMSLSLGAKFVWNPNWKSVGYAFAGFNPVSLAGTEFRTLSQLGGTIGIQLYGPILLTGSYNWRHTEVLTDGQSVGDVAIISSQASDPDVVTRKEWLGFWSAGIAVDLAPLGETLFKETTKLFDGDSN